MEKCICICRSSCLHQFSSNMDGSFSYGCLDLVTTQNILFSAGIGKLCKEKGLQKIRLRHRELWFCDWLAIFNWRMFHDRSHIWTLCSSYLPWSLPWLQLSAQVPLLVSLHLLRAICVVNLCEHIVNVPLKYFMLKAIFHNFVWDICCLKASLDTLGSSGFLLNDKLNHSCFWILYCSFQTYKQNLLTLIQEVMQAYLCLLYYQLLVQNHFLWEYTFYVFA